MANEIESAIKALQDKAGALSGVRAAPDYPPGAPPQGLVAIAVPANGTSQGMSAGWRESRSDVLVHIIMPLTDLARDVEKLLPLGDAFINAVEKDPTLGGVIQTVHELSWTFGQQVTYGDVQYIGWTFTVPVRHAPVLT